MTESSTKGYTFVYVALERWKLILTSSCFHTNPRSIEWISQKMIHIFSELLITKIGYVEEFWKQKL